MTGGRPERPALADALWIAGLTTAIEAVTCLFRFGLRLEAARDTSFLAPFTFGLRIHHGYIGLAMLAISALLPAGSPWRRRSVRLGGALLASDLVHHFAVLWLVRGDPEFFLTYAG